MSEKNKSALPKTKANYSQLTHIVSHQELALYDLIPDVVWIFDLDKHGWWWGNEAALKFWGLDCLEELINKDLSGDTQGARDRTEQTFELAVKNGLSIDPWTTYPSGKPKTLYMKHRAVLVGPERHRAIIAFINEEVNLGETPENLLLVEAMRYTSVLVTSFSFDGEIVIENPAATKAYKHIDWHNLDKTQSPFSARFADPNVGMACLAEAIENKGGRWTHQMHTHEGIRKHTLDIRITRHPLSGEFLILMAEYDVTQLHIALDNAQQAQHKLRKMAHYDAVTGIPSLHFLLEIAENYLAQAKRSQQKVAVMFLDLDGFKLVNDTWGHDAGDHVLVDVTQRLSAMLRETDQIARIGGDEFVVILDNIGNEQNAEMVAKKIIEELKNPIELLKSGHARQHAEIGVSVGISFYPDHGSNIESLIKAADNAMYHVKRHGKNAYSIAENQLS